MLCWLPVFVPTCSVDQVNWLICLEVGCQALMALDKQPVRRFALQPFWGLPQALPSRSGSGQRGWGTAAGKRASNRASKQRLLQPLTQQSGAVPMVQGDCPCYIAQRNRDGPLSPVHNPGKQPENRD